MTLLIDNDIVHKLAQLDLLEEAGPILKEKYGDLVVLNTLRFKFCPDKAPKRTRLERRYGADTLNRIEAFIDNHIATELDCEVTDIALLDAIMESSDAGLDAGEMQLLQALIDSPEACMFTGDKRFLKALAADENVATHRERFEESFVCFEQILIYLIKTLGFERVKTQYLEALSSGLQVDTTLRMCFEGRELAQQERVLENLSVHVGYLKTETSTMLSLSEEWHVELPESNEEGEEPLLE